MKKYAFLVPVAIAVSALVGVTRADTSVPGRSTARTTPASPEHSRANSGFTVATASGRVESFVLTRSEGGVLMAQHESHESHASHASHESHASHASHESHASHQSSTWLA